MPDLCLKNRVCWRLWRIAWGVHHLRHCASDGKDTRICAIMFPDASSSKATAVLSLRLMPPLQGLFTAHYVAFSLFPALSPFRFTPRLTLVQFSALRLRIEEVVPHFALFCPTSALFAALRRIPSFSLEVVHPKEVHETVVKSHRKNRSFCLVFEKNVWFQLQGPPYRPGQVARY